MLHNNYLFFCRLNSSGYSRPQVVYLLGEQSCYITGLGYVRHAQLLETQLWQCGCYCQSRNRSSTERSRLVTWCYLLFTLLINSKRLQIAIVNEFIRCKIELMIIWNSYVLEWCHLSVSKTVMIEEKKQIHLFIKETSGAALFIRNTAINFLIIFYQYVSFRPMI